MLRAGRIVEIGHLDTLRGLAAQRVRATLTSAVPDLSTIPGVTDVVVSGRSVECNVSGSMEPLVAALAAAGVEHLTTREVSLEELFVSQYGSEDGAATSDR